MRHPEHVADGVSVSLSVLCVIHCLALPVMATILPSLLAMPFSDERFHIWLVCAVIPISTYALTMGCKKHKNYQIWIPGVAGMAVLLTAALGGDVIGENLERVFTLIGAGIIALSHYWNFTLCREANCSDCAAKA